MASIDSSSVALPSGTQWQIAFQGHAAVIVEVGGGLRAYTADGEDVVDGYPAESLCPGGAGQALQPWPNRIRDGRLRTIRTLGGSQRVLMDSVEEMRAEH